ncbi:lyase family protein [Plantactinospora sp. KLBMP9567]|uniref:lyase family protein n=1 Tax=Plantactinospora sp. KLBMP9567 TaxID=3085900 RepID=UPI002981E96B|nr:lyase family protein [Plantactinospora sp. KLBMP9567]MDW5330285.1 lyase family protein [Plantactinospora sp. KLBMP9567]
MFESMFATPASVAATDTAAWLRELLRVEAALARAGAAIGLIPSGCAAEIEAACVPDRFDAAGLSRQAVPSASPVVPMVAELRARVSDDARRYVHLGATSQDVMDTALVLVARRCVGSTLDDLWAVGDRLADLADRHRDTVQIGRTLLQQAVPTSFGLVCANWLAALAEAADELARATDRLPLQYGGAVGAHDTLGIDGPRMAAALGEILGLTVPALPWHTRRGPVAGLAAALGAVCGALGTIATGVLLLAQNEVAEVTEGSPGGSSAMPHKRNPARSTLVVACVHQAPALVATILASQPVELQRSAGRWQAEWPTVTTLLRLTAAAAWHARSAAESLQVDSERMRAAAGLGPGSTTAGPPGVPEAAGPLIDRALEAYRATRP